MAPGPFCCGSTPPSPVQAHSLQGEGEVILAGLAVAHQVAGLLAQPQQRLCVRPADGPVVPAGDGRGNGCARQRADTPGRTMPWGSSNAGTPGTSPGTAAVFGERDVRCHRWGWGTRGRASPGQLRGVQRAHKDTTTARQAAGTSRQKRRAREERKKRVCPRAPRGVATGRGAGRTHHWLSKGRAGSILSPTKGPGSAISVLVLLRLLEPCLRAALAFSSLQGEVRPYPSPSDGPARQTHVTAGSGDRWTGWAPSFPRRGENPQKETEPRHVVLGPLMLPRPPAFSKGRTGQLLDCCSLQCPRTDKVAYPPRQDRGPHSTRAPGNIFQGGFKSSKGFC